jgi:hypothetical protein
MQVLKCDQDVDVYALLRDACRAVRARRTRHVVQVVSAAHDVGPRLEHCS